MRTAILSFLVVTSFASLAAAAETPPEEMTHKETAPIIGAHAGGIATGEHLGPGLDLSLDVGMRKRFGHYAFVTGLRPHYERYGVGQSQVSSCANGNGACGNGAIAARSQTHGDALGLEIPLILEYHFTGITPFIGVSPSLVWFRATERAEGLLPSGATEEHSGSATFLAVSGFLGLAVPITQHGYFTARGGYRYAAFKDLPGGQASLRGVIGSIGYTYEL